MVASDVVQQLAVVAEHVREQAATEGDSVAYNRLEHGLHTCGRGADYTKNFGGRGLLLQRLASVVDDRWVVRVRTAEDNFTLDVLFSSCFSRFPISNSMP